MLRRATILAVVSTLVALWGAPHATAAVAPNDNFANATTFSGNFGNAYQDIYEATNEPGEPLDHGYRTIWFRWTPSESGRVSVTTCSDRTTPDTVLAAYTGASLGSLTRVALNDQDEGCWFDGPSSIEFDAVAGTTYRFSVGYYDLPEPWPFGDYAEVSLWNVPHPYNDNLASAHPLNETFPSVQASTYSGTREPGEPVASGNNTQWYYWTAPQTGQVLVDTCTPGEWEELTDTVLAAYTGSAVNALTQVARDDDSAGCGNGKQSRISWAAVAGTTYRISVGKPGSTSGGGFTLKLRMPPPNDYFANAATLTTPVTNYNVGATRESGEPADNGDRTLWYRWTAPSTGQAKIDTGCGLGGGGPGIDTLLVAYTGSSVNALTEVTRNDNGNACGTGSRVRFMVTQGESYYLSVGSPHEGSFTMTATVGSPGPPNDDWADAITITGYSVSGDGSNAGATHQQDEPFYGYGSSVWYRWTAPVSDQVTIGTCTGTNFNSTVAAYTGTTLTSLIQVAMGENTPGCGSGDRGRITFAATAGTIYHIVVADNHLVPGGTFRLSLDQPQPPQLLTVSMSGLGDGTVTSSPAGIDCGDDCSQSYTANTPVTLTATPDAGSSFLGWSGACTGTGACQVTMSEARSVTAGFAETPLEQHVLAVSRSGNGQGVVASNPSGINCGADCAQGYAGGTPVTLTATAASGSSFAGWSGACSGTGTCRVTMSAARSVTATFTVDGTGPDATEDPPPPPGPEEPLDPPAIEGPLEPPDTVIKKAKVRSKQAAAKFTFEARNDAEGDATFECKITNQSKKLRQWQDCDSPQRYEELKPGRHVFGVRATREGLTDRTPATETIEIEPNGE